MGTFRYLVRLLEQLKAAPNELHDTYSTVHMDVRLPNICFSNCPSRHVMLIDVNRFSNLWLHTLFTKRVICTLHRKTDVAECSLSQMVVWAGSKGLNHPKFMSNYPVHGAETQLDTNGAICSEILYLHSTVDLHTSIGIETFGLQLVRNTFLWVKNWSSSSQLDFTHK